jgi:hypothetical protein
MSSSSSPTRRKGEEKRWYCSHSEASQVHYCWLLLTRLDGKMAAAGTAAEISAADKERAKTQHGATLLT